MEQVQGAFVPDLSLFQGRGQVRGQDVKTGVQGVLSGL
jgi:hypothetical protein